MFLPTDRFDYENVDFANDLSAGVPVSGEAPLAGSTPPPSPPFGLSMEQRRASLP